MLTNVTNDNQTSLSIPVTFYFWSILLLNSKENMICACVLFSLCACQAVHVRATSLCGGFMRPLGGCDNQTRVMEPQTNCSVLFFFPWWLLAVGRASRHPGSSGWGVLVPQSHGQELRGEGGVRAGQQPQVPEAQETEGRCGLLHHPLCRKGKKTLLQFTVSASSRVKVEMPCPEWL